MFTGRLAVLARLRRPERRPFFTGKSPREKTNYKRSLPVWTVDKSGDVLRAELSKHAVLEAFPSVLARDLRTLDDRRRMISEILVREQALVFKVEHLRVVVNRSRAVIFDAEQPVVTAFAAKLGEELADTMTRQADAVGMANVACALELSVLECVLAAVAENFDHRFSLLDTITRQLLRNVASQSFDEAAQRLVPVKRSIATLHTALDEYRAALAAVVAGAKAMKRLLFAGAILTRPLQTQRLAFHRRCCGLVTQVCARVPSQALSGLYLPGHTHPEHARDAVAAAEIALSDHIKRAEELLNELEDLREGVLSAEATATQSLASTRNNLMSLNLQISLASLGFSTAACGFSAFGMNLPTGFETTPGSFYWATLGVGACSVAVWSSCVHTPAQLRSRVVC